VTDVGRQQVNKALHEDRRDAGQKLTQQLGRYISQRDVIVLGLVR
jgi:predicted phosphoribosyltransferase